MLLFSTERFAKHLDSMKLLTIGKLASLARVNTETIRYYERRKLIPKPATNAAGYRQYGQKDLGRLVFIRRCLRLGLSLDDIQELLTVHKSTTSERSSQLEKAARKTEERQTDLEQLYSVIWEMLNEEASRQEDIIDRLTRMPRWQEAPD